MPGGSGSRLQVPIRMPHELRRDIDAKRGDVPLNTWCLRALSAYAGDPLDALGANDELNAAVTALLAPGETPQSFILRVLARHVEDGASVEKSPPAAVLQGGDLARSPVDLGGSPPHLAAVPDANGSPPRRPRATPANRWGR